MKRIALLLLALAVTSAPAALTDLDNPGPALMSVHARQRYPWNGLVDIDVSFEAPSTGYVKTLTFEARDLTGGTNLPISTVRCPSVNGGEPANPVSVPASGTYRFVWDAGADLPEGFAADRVTVTATLAVDPITYMVKFNANATDATGSMPDESFTYDTAKALTANSFQKTGYRFAGWALTATGAKVFDDKQTVSNLTVTAGAAVDLYGLWATNAYTVRFNKNAADATGSMENQYGFRYDIEAGLRANAFSRTGYTFAGWATSATGAKVYNDKQKVKNLTATHSATVDLYAVWTANTYSVKFNANGGTGTMANQTFTYGVAQALTANAFTRTGHTFGGWATSTTGAKAYNDKQSVSNLTATADETVNLYAKWSANTYSVTLDRQSGTGGSGSATATYGSAMPAITAPTRTGYTFGGYYTSANGGGTQYYTAAGASARNWDKTAATTLYAKWTANTYSVKFNANGGTGTMANQTFTYGVAQALTANAFTRTGHTFGGWATSETGSVRFADGNILTSLSKEQGDVVVLYAVWVFSGVWYVDMANGSDANDGHSWQTAKKNIQSAVSLASTGHIIMVGPGIYSPIKTENKAITIQSSKGAESTIIDGEGEHTCAHLGKTGRDTVVVGFTFRNGYINEDGGGAGVKNGTVRNCIFHNNEGHGYGTACGAKESDLHNCLFYDNTFSWLGSSSNWNTEAYGSAVYGGATVHCNLVNCTIVNNTGFGAWDCSVQNSILWGNTFDYYESPHGSPVLEYSCFSSAGCGNTPLTRSLTGCISSDPQFSDASNWNFRLSSSSPCINAGNNNLVNATEDLDGKWRIQMFRVDMGCYEQ